MPIIHVGIGAASSGTTGNGSLAMPACAVGDLLILAFMALDNVACTLPSGWTIQNETNNGASVRAWWAWKIADGKEGANINVEHINATAWRGNITAYRGVDTVSPITQSSANAPAASATITATTVTPAADGMVVFATGYSVGGSATVSGWSGTDPTFTERYDHNSGATGTGLAMADGLSSGAATGSRTTTCTLTATSVGFLIALKPATDIVTGDVTFTITSATNDGGGSNANGSASWPPTGGGFTSDEAGNDCNIGWSFQTPDYFSDNGYFRWDTSVLSDKTAIAAATFRPTTGSLSNPEGGTTTWFVEAEYYDFGGEPSTVADWKYNSSPSIFQTTTYSNLRSGTDQRQAIPIVDLSGISRSSFTGIRCTANRPAGAPTTTNLQSLRAFEYSSGTFAAQLEVKLVNPTITPPAQMFFP